MACALAAAAAGCSSAKPAPVYDLPVNELYQRLLGADINGFRTARQCGLLIHFKKQAVVDREIIWRVTSSGREMLWFKITLIPEGANKTRAEIDVSPDPAGGEKYDGDYFEMHPAVHQPLRPAVKELIDSAIARRPYDVWKIPPPINTNDNVCSVQRGAVERGTPFHIDDGPADGPGDSQKRKARAAAPAPSPSPSPETEPDAGWGDGDSE